MDVRRLLVDLHRGILLGCDMARSSINRDVTCSQCIYTIQRS